MKKIFLFFSLFFSYSLLFGIDYYVSAVSGNDANNGTSTLTAWKTLSKVNASTFSSGDRILFESNSVFYGSLTVNTDFITFSSYGTGNKPVISGFVSTQTNSWTDMGNGIWKTNVPSSIDRLNVVMSTKDNTPQEIARYPDPNDTNSGYLTYEGFGQNYVVDNESPFTASWNGADVCVRVTDYVLERHNLANINSTTINFGLASNINGFTNKYFFAYQKSNYGYFLQNHILALSRMGEWVYSTTTKDLFVYFGAGNSPAIYGSPFKISTVDVLLNIGSHNNISVSNIRFEGANRIAISSAYPATPNFIAHDISVLGCDFEYIGARAIDFLGTSNVIINNCKFNWCLSNAIQCYKESSSGWGHDITISNCTIFNTAPYVGMSSYIDNGDSHAIHVAVSSGLLIENNVIQNVGKSGIMWQGANVIIRKNVIDNAVKSFIDYGGIYSWIGSASSSAPKPKMLTYTQPVPPGGSQPLDYYGNREISNNIISNCYGQANGTLNTSGKNGVGIYNDGESMNINILNNTVFNVGKNAIESNNPSSINISNNLFYNYSRAGISIGKWYSTTVTQLNINVSNNLFFSTQKDAYNISYSNNAFNLSGVTIQQELQNIGIINNNYYNYFSGSLGIGNYYKEINPSSFRIELYNYDAVAKKVTSIIPFSELSLSNWRILTSQDLLSKEIVIKSYYDAIQPSQIVGSNKYSNGAFASNVNGINTVNKVSSFNSLTVTSAITKNWDNSFTPEAPGCLRLDLTNTSNIADQYPSINSQLSGTIENSKNYLLRFRLKGTSDHGILKAFIRRYASPYENLVAPQKRIYNSFDQTHEFLFTNPTFSDGALSGTASFVIQFENNSGTTYIDNLELFETTATPLTDDKIFKFVVNNTNSTMKVQPNNLGLSFYQWTPAGLQCFGGSFNQSLSLQPYTGTMLFYTKLFYCPQPKTMNSIDLLNNNKLIVSPNPVSEILNVTIPKTVNCKLFKIYNTSGVEIFTSSKIAQYGDKVGISVSDLKSGLYIIKIITSKNETLVSKFTKI